MEQKMIKINAASAHARKTLAFRHGIVVRDNAATLVVRPTDDVRKDTWCQSTKVTDTDRSKGMYELLIKKADGSTAWRPVKMTLDAKMMDKRGTKRWGEHDTVFVSAIPMPGAKDDLQGRHADRHDWHAVEKELLSSHSPFEVDELVKMRDWSLDEVNAVIKNRLGYSAL